MGVHIHPVTCGGKCRGNHKPDLRWLGVVFLGIFGSGPAYTAWYDALQALSAAQTGVFLYIEPLVAVAVAFFVLGESITIISLPGAGSSCTACGW
jgi:drug/metabolite transporter (DMT)-like permease